MSLKQVSTAAAICWQRNPSCGGKVAILVAMAPSTFAAALVGRRGGRSYQRRRVWIMQHPNALRSAVQPCSPKTKIIRLKMWPVRPALAD
jgi:hypothetical protein